MMWFWLTITLLPILDCSYTRSAFFSFLLLCKWCLFLDWTLKDGNAVVHFSQEILIYTVLSILLTCSWFRHIKDSGLIVHTYYMQIQGLQCRHEGVLCSTCVTIKDTHPFSPHSPSLSPLPLLLLPLSFSYPLLARDWWCVRASWVRYSSRVWIESQY